jgi:hypothetical protein
MTGRQGLLRITAAAVFATAAACVDRLPDQDLRILTATPAERLSATLLWEDYQQDRGAADQRYRGRAIVITGTATTIGSGEPGQRFLTFARPEGPGGVRAHLLDDQASAILTAARENPKLALKCFCEGLADVVVLKSCVNP